MSESAIRSRSSFLEVILDLIIFNGHSRLGAYFAEWVPDSFRDRLSRRNVTARGYVDYCGENGALEEAITKAISNVHRDWNMLKPRTKKELIGIIQQYEMKGAFEPYILTLSPSDKEELSIPFDAAELLYDQRKQRVFDKARNSDGILDLFQLSSRDEVFRCMIQLLEKMHDYCVAAVRHGAPHNVSRYMELVDGMVYSEFHDLLAALRTSLDKLIRYLSEGTDRFQGSISWHVQNNLEPFVKQYEALQVSFCSSIRDERIYHEMVEFLATRRKIEGPPSTRIFVNRRKNTFYGPAAYTERGDIKDFSQDLTVGSEMQKVDLKALAGELSTLLVAAKEQANSADHFKQLAGIAEAEEASMSGNRSETAHKLKLLGKWALDLARETGVELAAKVISSQIGGV